MPEPKSAHITTDHPAHGQVRGRGAVTLRAIATGSACVAVLSALLPYNDYILANTMLVGSYLPLAGVLAMFILVVLVNGLLHRYRPTAAFASGELAVILTMTLVACSIPGQGLLRALLPSMVAPFYFGQQNQTFWDAFTRMDLPGWLFPVDSIDTGRTSRQVQEFYGRSPAGLTPPLSAWVVPLLGHGLFVLGLMLTLISLAFLLRVQWGRNERLAFPLAQLQLALIEAPRPGRSLNTLFAMRSFWITAGAVFAIHSLSVLADYFPRQVTRIPLSYDFTSLLSEAPFDKLPWDIKRGTVFFTFVGVTYFIQSRVAFSLWSIWVVTQLLTMQTRVLGGDIPLVAWRDQHLGACVMYVAGMLWLGRMFWWRVLRSFRGGDPAVAIERRAMVGLAAGVSLLVGWLMLTGAGPWMTLLAVSIILVAHLSTARVVAETGLPFIRTLVWPQQVFTNFPARSIDARDVFLVGMATSNGVYSNRESALSFSQHALRVCEGVQLLPREARKVAAVIVWALLLALVVGVPASLHAYYGYNSQIARGEPMIENKYGLQTIPE
ncbi:MAG: hypothetical protein NZ561_10510, partial [Phycisphaerae bacterium]|nr:hypothetical protein [Phycisphaerae bacterium]